MLDHRTAPMLLALVGLAAASAGQDYTLDLIATRGSAVAINNLGQAVGNAEFGNLPGQKGYVWTPTDGFTELPMQADLTRVVPAAISDDGVIVGSFRPSGVQNDERALLIDADGTPVILNDEEFGDARAIDGQGRIYGIGDRIPTELFLFGTPDSLENTQLLPGQQGAIINGAGPSAAVGAVDSEAAVIFPDNTFEFLADPGAVGLFFVRKFAVDQNDSGVVIGNVVERDPNTSELATPIIWDADGVPSNLPRLSNAFEDTRVADINNNGDVAGRSFDQNSLTGLATVWFDGQPVDLNSLVDTPSNIILTAANAINDAGVIVGNFVDTTRPLGSAQGAFVLTPNNPGCNPADLAEPFGVLDLADVQEFTQAFVAGDPAADVDGSGVFDLADIQGFVAAFSAGCP